MDGRVEALNGVSLVMSLAVGKGDCWTRAHMSRCNSLS